MAKQTAKEPTMAKSNGNGNGAGAVHLMLQGKGGVGKSTCSAFLAQYLREKGRDVACLDTDPVNHTLAGYEGLPVEIVELMDEGEVNSKRFDQVIVKVLGENKDFVIDSGASSFISLWNYILQNEVVPLLTANGRRVYIHTIVAGGGALLETISNLKELAKTTPDRNLVVWVNEHEARAEMDGKKLGEMAAYRASESKVLGNIVVERRNPQTFGSDLRKMISDRLTFTEAIARPEYNVMERQRLAVVRRGLYEQLDGVEFGA